jgi:hypothetical protein
MIFVRSKLITFENFLFNTFIIFLLFFSSFHFIIFVAKEKESYPKNCQFLGVQITLLSKNNERVIMKSKNKTVKTNIK